MEEKVLIKVFRVKGLCFVIGDMDIRAQKIEGEGVVDRVLLELVF